MDDIGEPPLNLRDCFAPVNARGVLRRNRQETAANSTQFLPKGLNNVANIDSLTAHQFVLHREAICLLFRNPCPLGDQIKFAIRRRGATRSNLTQMLDVADPTRV